MRLFSALVIGAIFGLGIAISGMANPAKVLNFFDIAGTWDPSLLLVMVGALVTTAIGYRIVFRRMPAPRYERAYNVPGNRTIDARLIGGAAVFGIGWGITGFCPGGAIPALGLAEPETFIFMAAMVAGILAARFLQVTVLKTATI
ncbi:DUF6691 family protein [Oricola indica]|uniref:DUF6691 family protein n=1 Tax=Oricola indica TaxID=2872591 RepID=UPI003CCC3961